MGPGSSYRGRPRTYLIAFYVGPDPTRIDSIFRMSGLMRDKWANRPEYRECKIERALGDRTEYFGDDHDDEYDFEFEDVTAWAAGLSQAKYLLKLLEKTAALRDAVREGRA